MTNTFELHPLIALIDEWDKAGLLEDRLEYSIEDLMHSESLTEAEATHVQRLIHEDSPGYRPF